MTKNLTKIKSFSELTKAEKLEFKKTMPKLMETVDNLSDILQVHIIDIWKFLRSKYKSGVKWLAFADWTDQELDNYDKETGLIGNKCGVYCYMVDSGDYANKDGA